jgi:hypothetical protein
MNQNADEKGYNGWKNYETWSVALIVDNDQRTYNEAREITRDAIENGESSEFWTEEERRRYRVADALKDWVETELEESTQMTEAQPFSYLVAQLVRAAVGDVDWDAIADNYIEEVVAEAQ